MSLSETTSQLISRAITNFNNIRQAIIDKGVDLTYNDSDDYASKIGEIDTVNNTNLNVTPSTSSQQFSASSPYTGFGEVNVSAVDANIDNNIIPGNIKSGVDILGVTGTYTGGGGTMEQITVVPSISQQVITPSTGFDGIDEVTVEAVDSSIDNNIVASNIKNGVTILGVQGTYTGGGTPNLQSKSVTPDFSNGDVQVQADSGYDGLSDVTIVKDSDLIASNIKKNVEIFGVTGSYEVSGIVLNTHPDNLQYACTGGTSYANVLPADGSWTTEVDLVNITSNNNMRYMFQNNTVVEDIDLTGWTIPDLAISGQGMFSGCSNLKYVRGSLSFAKSTTFTNMFSGCTSLIQVGITNFGFSASTTSITLDLSASANLDAATLITNMETNNSGKTRIIALESTVLAGLSSTITALAASKNITLQ